MSSPTTPTGIDLVDVEPSRPRPRRRPRESDARRGKTARGPRRRDEAGDAPVLFLVFTCLALFALGGLVIDGGYALADRREALDQSQQAARIGADALSQGGLRSGRTVVEAGRAQAAAQGYLSRVGTTGNVKVTGDTVTVTVQGSYNTKILAIVGVGQIPVHATSSSISIDERDQ